MNGDLAWQTKDGRPIHMQGEEDIEPENRGWITHCMTAFVDGQEAGYLKVSYIPSYNVPRYYPDVTWYLAQIRGCWRLISDDPINRLVALSEQVDSWHDWLNKDEVLNMSPDERAEREAKYIELLHEQYRRQFEDHLDYLVDKPYVDYILVHDAFRRLGIGTALYAATAFKLAEKGLRLYSSTLQSKEAEAVWKHMASDPLLSDYIGRESAVYNDETYWRRYLDFTSRVLDRGEGRVAISSGLRRGGSLRRKIK